MNKKQNNSNNLDVRREKEILIKAGINRSIKYFHKVPMVCEIYWKEGIVVKS